LVNVIDDGRRWSMNARRASGGSSRPGGSNGHAVLSPKPLRRTIQREVETRLSSMVGLDARRHVALDEPAMRRSHLAHRRTG
jgi:hypothetical protein